jgi:hypothetical protein
MLCQLCQERVSCIKCTECDIPLCSHCVKLDLYGTGCGCIGPIHMCPTCFEECWLPPGVTADSYNAF